MCVLRPCLCARRSWLLLATPPLASQHHMSVLAAALIRTGTAGHATAAPYNDSKQLVRAHSADLETRQAEMIPAVASVLTKQEWIVSRCGQIPENRPDQDLWRCEPVTGRWSTSRFNRLIGAIGGYLSAATRVKRLILKPFLPLLGSNLQIPIHAANKRVLLIANTRRKLWFSAHGIIIIGSINPSSVEVTGQQSNVQTDYLAAYCNLIAGNQINHTCSRITMKKNDGARSADVVCVCPRVAMKRLLTTSSIVSRQHRFTTKLLQTS